MMLVAFAIIIHGAALSLGMLYSSTP
jgi:hypothetical protein